VTGATGRAALALMVWCGFCWAAPGTACASDGQHLARYLRAYRRGLIGKDAVAALCQGLPRVSAGQLVADVTEPRSRAAVGNDGRRMAALGED
jgi:hypothetical protein